MSKSSPPPHVHGPLPKYVSCMHQADIYRNHTHFQPLIRTINVARIQMELLKENSFDMFLKMGLKVMSLMEGHLFYLLSFGSDGQSTPLLKVL